MDEKRKRLLELIEELQFPYLPEEARENAEKLSEEDLDFLLQAYEKVRSCRIDLDDASKDLNPEESGKIDGEYQKKMLDLDLAYADKMEEVRKKEDSALDRTESDTELKLNDTLQGIDEDTQEVEDVVDSLITRVKILLSLD